MSDPNQPNPATIHQAFQGFPRIDAPMVDPATGIVTQPWQRLFIRLWQMAGGSLTALQSTGILSLSPDGSEVTVNNAGSGKAIGVIGLPSPSAPQASLAGLSLLPPQTEPLPAANQVVILPPPAEPARDFSTQMVMMAPPEAQIDFSPLVVVAPPAEPLPDPLLLLALSPLAGLV